MKYQIRLIAVGFLSFLLNAGMAQSHRGWTPEEQRFYDRLTSFCNYLEADPSNITHSKEIFRSYVYFDYVLNDTTGQRMASRIEKFDTLIGLFKKYLDSAGRQNLDARPVRYYKGGVAFYRPFAGNLKEYAGRSFAYFNKSRPGKPLGYLLFDTKSGKLISWILLNQGGHYYFLTFNLL